jgi:hypothetical protein
MEDTSGRAEDVFQGEMTRDDYTRDDYTPGEPQPGTSELCERLQRYLKPAFALWISEFKIQSPC